MKLNNIKKYIKWLWVLAAAGCSDPDYPAPNIATEASAGSASVRFINASPDAPELNLIVNNGTTTATSGIYTTIPITANGVFQNTNLRARAVTGSIGGALEGNDLVYRATNNGTNNFQAANGAKYTIIVVDTIGRPKPLRTLNTFKVGDTTFFNPLTEEYLSVIERARLSPAKKAKLIPIGTVPAGSTDPGGIRFYITTDIYPTFAAGNDAQAGIRLINAATLPNNLHVRLNGAVDIGLTSSSGAGYVLGFPTLNPAVGSRTLTSTGANTPLSFTLQNIAVTNVPNTYTLEIATDAAFTNIVYSLDNVTFDVGGVYSIIIKGKRLNGLSTVIIKHN